VAEEHGGGGTADRAWNLPRLLNMAGPGYP
jgi:hypothetical protein